MKNTSHVQKIFSVILSLILTSSFISLSANAAGSSTQDGAIDFNDLFPSTPPELPNLVVTPLPNSGGNSDETATEDGNKGGGSKKNKSGKASAGNGANGRPNKQVSGTASSNGKQSSQGSGSQFNRSQSLMDIKCPLVDNRTHRDLELATSNLSASLEPLRQCAEKAGDVAPFVANVTAIIKAAKSLKAGSSATEALISDPSKLTDLESNVDVMIKGIDSITNAIGGSEILSSKCAKGGVKGADIMIGLGDVIEAVTPYAMTALQTNPEFSAAIPFVIGAAGVGKVAKVIGKMNKENSLDMSDPKTRNAVLENICEYTRIVQRNDAFKKARRGTNGNISETPLAAGNIYKPTSVNTSKLSAPAAAMIQTNQDIQIVTAQVSNTATNDLILIEGLRREIETPGQEKDVTCYTVRNQMLLSEDSNKLSSRVINNLVGLMNDEKTSTYINETNLSFYNGLLMAEDGLRKKLLADVTSSQESSIAKCATYSKSYIQVLGRIANAAQVLANSIQSKADENLSSSKLREVRNYAMTAISERKQQEKIAVLTASAIKHPYTAVYGGTATLKEDPISDSNIDRDIRLAKESLFGIKPGTLPSALGFSVLLNYAKGDSPALAWYLDIAGLAKIAEKDFLQELTALRLDTFQYLTRAGRNDYTEVDAKGKKIQIWNFLEALAIWNVDQESAQDLAPLNLNAVKPFSEAHTDMCRRISNTMNKWQGVIDHLSSLNLFCGYLKPFVDSSFDPRFIQACLGAKEPSGKIIRNSDLTQIKEDVRKKSLEGAKLIYKKYAELQCSQFED